MIASMNADELDAKLCAWREEHNTPEKVASTHRKVLLERVSQSMALENQPISMERLKPLAGDPESQSQLGSAHETGSGLMR